MVTLSSGQRDMREFLFSYRFDGTEWGITIFADDATQAREKIKAVALARYDGELHMRIPAGASLFGLVPRLILWLRQRKWLGVH